MTATDPDVLQQLDFTPTFFCEVRAHDYQPNHHDDGPVHWYQHARQWECGHSGAGSFVCDSFKASLQRQGRSTCPYCGKWNSAEHETFTWIA